MSPGAAEQELAGACARQLGPEFFGREVVEVARDLIGVELTVSGVGGVIVETEAYREDEPACHAHRGLTPRTEPLFGPPGRAYVYLNYGIHRLLNFVAGPEGHGAAVLIRAIEPLHGLDRMVDRRGTGDPRALCSGPGKVGQALRVELAQNHARLDAEPFSLRRAPSAKPVEVIAGTRIGIRVAAELPWRFCAAGSPFVSKPWPR